MLDSNTDRSYFMIGAIIVGALIIAGAVLIFTNIFGDSSGGGYIANLLESLFHRAGGEIDGIDGIDAGVIVPAIKGIFGGIF